MSDQEMQFFPESNHEPGSPASRDWSPQAYSAPSDPLFQPYEHDEKADKQSLDLIWGRLEEHVSRNREYYRHSPNVPALHMQSSPVYQPYPSFRHQPVSFLRTLPWRRVDTLAALLFLALLMGSLLTVVYQVGQHTQLGSSAEKSFSLDSALCKSVLVENPRVTILKGQQGLEVSPHRVVLQQGAQLTWVNETSDAQVVINAATKDTAIKIGMRSKSLQFMKSAAISTYIIQPLSSLSSDGVVADVTNAKFVLEVVNSVMIVPDKNGAGATFSPPVLKIAQNSDLVWLNRTQDKQEVVNMNSMSKQKEALLKSQATLSFLPGSCHVQHAIPQGSYSYALKSSLAQFSLYAG